MSLSKANKEESERVNLLKESIKKDILECYPVSCGGANIILLNDKLYFKQHTFYSFNELFISLDINNCSYNKNTYCIKDRG